MKKSAYSLAVVGATGLVGGEIIAILEQRQFPIADLQLYASPQSAGDKVRCGDVTARVDVLETARFDGTDIVFLAADERVTAEWVERATGSGAVVIDTSQLFADHPDVPLVVPEVNASDLAAYEDRRLVSSPDSLAVALAVVLEPLHAAAAMRRVVASTYEPVSGCGRAGINELQQQTIELVSGRSVEPEVFSRRIAFNVLPHVGEFLAGGTSRAELQTISALRRLLHSPELSVSVTRVRVPVFYGSALSVNIETVEPMTAAQAGEILRSAPGVLLQDDLATQLYPTPADTVGQDDMCVGRIRADDSMNILDLWIATDNIRKGSALNAVQIAETLIRDYL